MRRMLPTTSRWQKKPHEGFKGRQQAEWLARMEREHDNVRATLAWMLEPAQAGPGIEKALRLVVALHAFWDVRGHYREALSYLEQALARSEGVTASVRARALKSAGQLCPCAWVILMGQRHGFGRVSSCSARLAGETRVALPLLFRDWGG